MAASEASRCISWCACLSMSGQGENKHGQNKHGHDKKGGEGHVIGFVRSNVVFHES